MFMLKVKIAFNPNLEINYTVDIVVSPMDIIYRKTGQTKAYFHLLYKKIFFL